MNIDFIDDEYRFNARSCAIIYNKDKTKVLLFKADEARNFYMLPGGRIQHFEDSKTAIIREMQEELGWNLNYNFCAIQENFLEAKSQKITQYSFCYKAIYNEEITKETFACLDNDYQHFYWVDIDKLYNYKILPNSNKDLILGNNKDIHIIERN